MSEPLLYTALIGPYDTLKEHSHHRSLSFCFTDQVNIKSSSWTIIPCKSPQDTVDGRIRTARYYKALAHRFLPPHDVSVWVDASIHVVEITTARNWLYREDMATFRYPDTYGPRDCAYDEANACINRGKDAQDIIVGQMNRYVTAGFPRNAGLVETTVLARRNTASVREFNEAWWREISGGSRRDQLSFNYCCWRLGLSYACLPGHRLCNPFGKYAPHRQSIYLGSPYTTGAIHESTLAYHPT